MAMQGPGYTTSDLVYYTGMFGGIILVYLSLAGLEWHPLIRLVLGLVVGIGLGTVLELAYRRSKQPPPPPPPFND